MNPEIPGVKILPRAAARAMGALGLILGLILGVVLWAAPAAAVTFDQQAERLQLIYSYLLDYRPMQGPVLSRQGSFELALEFTPLPSIDNRVGAKDEPVNPPPVIPRPRARYHSASGLVLGVSYTPPLEVSGYEAEMAALEAGFRWPMGNWRAGLRGFALDGEVRGPITDPVSADRFQLTNIGVDALAGLQIGFWLPYGGVGRGTTSSTLTIRSDQVMLDADKSFTYLLAGLTADFDSLRFTFEQYRTDTVLDHYSISLSWVF